MQMSLHVMTGKARLRARLCPVAYTAKYENYAKECVISDEDMLREDPEEKQEAHLGSEAE